jgi:hypothetical protein
VFHFFWHHVQVMICTEWVSLYICTLRMIYYAYFHSVMRYGIVFGGNSPDAKKIFLLQKRAVRVMIKESSFKCSF